MINKLDDLDLKIIRQLQNDGRISVTDLAEKVGSSRPTITNRLKQLMDQELVIIKGGLNLKRFGFKIASVGLEVTSEPIRTKLEKMLKACPRVLDIYKTPEKANIQLRVWGEDEQAINSTIESFRDLQDVDVVYTHYLGTPIHGVITVNVGSGNKEEPPCGKICTDCYRYDSEWCPGCPSSKYYKDSLVR